MKHSAALMLKLEEDFHGFYVQCINIRCLIHFDNTGRYHAYKEECLKKYSFKKVSRELR